MAKESGKLDTSFGGNLKSCGCFIIVALIFVAIIMAYFFSSAKEIISLSIENHEVFLVDGYKEIRGNLLNKYIVVSEAEIHVVTYLNYEEMEEIRYRVKESPIKIGERVMFKIDTTKDFDRYTIRVRAE